MVAPPDRVRESERRRDRAESGVASSLLIEEYLRDQDQRLVRIGNSRDRYRTADGGEVRLDNRGRPVEICGPLRSDRTRALITNIRYDSNGHATHMSYGAVGPHGSRSVRENWRLATGPEGPVWTTAAEGAPPDSGRQARCGPVTISRHGVVTYNEIDRRGTTHSAVRDLRNRTIFVPRDGQLTPVGEPGERRFETSDRSEVRLDEHGRPLEILGPVRSDGSRAMITGIRYHGDTNYATHMSYGSLDRSGNRVLRENWRLIPNEGGPGNGGLWTTAPEGARPERGRQQRCGPVTVSRDGVVNYNDTSRPGRTVAALRDRHNRTIFTPYQRAEAPSPRQEPPDAPPPPRPDAPPLPMPRIEEDPSPAPYSARELANGNRFEAYTELDEFDRPTNRYRIVDSQGRVMQQGTIGFRVHRVEEDDQGRLILWPERGDEGLSVNPDGTTRPIFRVVPSR